MAMEVYIYEGALYCEDCARSLEGEADGPYPDGGGEADTPQHCDSCGVFLENPLTADGRSYVCKAVLDYLRHKVGIYSVIEEWAVWYGIDVSELMELVREE